MKLQYDDIPTGPVIIERDELEILYEFVKNQFIHYENASLMKLIREIRLIISQDDE